MSQSVAEAKGIPTSKADLQIGDEGLGNTPKMVAEALVPEARAEALVPDECEGKQGKREVDDGDPLSEATPKMNVWDMLEKIVGNIPAEAVRECVAALVLECEGKPEAVQDKFIDAAIEIAGDAITVATCSEHCKVAALGKALAEAAVKEGAELTIKGGIWLPAHGANIEFEIEKRIPLMTSSDTKKGVHSASSELEKAITTVAETESTSEKGTSLVTCEELEKAVAEIAMKKGAQVAANEGIKMAALKKAVAEVASKVGAEFAELKSAIDDAMTTATKYGLSERAKRGYVAATVSRKGKEMLIAKESNHALPPFDFDSDHVNMADDHQCGNRRRQCGNRRRQHGNQRHQHGNRKGGNPRGNQGRNRGNQEDNQGDNQGDNQDSKGGKKSGGKKGGNRWNPGCPKRGHHVINHGVIKVFQKILDTMNSVHFNRMNLVSLVNSGYIIRQDYCAPLSKNCAKFIESTTVSFDRPGPDKNASEFGRRIVSLVWAICIYMNLLFNYLRECTNHEELTARYWGLADYPANGVTITSMIRELISQDVCVDKQARDKWLNGDGTRKERVARKREYDTVHHAVATMFRKLDHRDGGSLGVTWVRYLYSVYRNIVYRKIRQGRPMQGCGH